MREQNQEQQGGRYPIPHAQVVGDRDQSLRYQLEPNDIIEEVEHILRSEVLVRNEDGSTSYKQIAKPLMNEEGINAVRLELHGRLTKVFIMSDLEAADVRDMVKGAIDSLIDDIDENWEDYGIQNMAQASKICRLVADNIFATLRKAHKGTYQKFLSTVHQDVHQTVRQEAERRAPKPQQSSPLSALKRLVGR